LGFANQYARAREAQTEALAEQIIPIADDATEEDAQVARLRVDVRKWIASKILPKKYGDKVQNEISGSLTVESVSFKGGSRGPNASPDAPGA